MFSSTHEIISSTLTDRINPNWNNNKIPQFSCHKQLYDLLDGLHRYCCTTIPFVVLSWLKKCATHAKICCCCIARWSTISATSIPRKMCPHVCCTVTVRLLLYCFGFLGNCAAPCLGNRATPLGHSFSFLNLLLFLSSLMVCSVCPLSLFYTLKIVTTYLNHLI